MRRVLIVPVLVVTLGFAACGDDGESAASGRELAGAVPADAVVFVEGSIGPGGDQRKALFEVANKVDPRDVDLEDALIRELDKKLTRELERKPSYGKDIEPWLGDRVALALSSAGKDDTHSTLVLEATDTASAQEFVEKLRERGDRSGTHRGVRYLIDADEGGVAGVTDELLLIADDERSFRNSVDAVQGGRSLAADAVYRTATKELPEERLGLVYVDGGRLSELLVGLGLALPGVEDAVKDIPGANFNGPTAMAVTVDDGRIAIESSSDAAEARRFERQFGRGEDLADFPKDAWLALSGPFPGRALVEGLTGTFMQSFDRGLGQELNDIPPEIRDEVRRETEAIGREIERTLDRLAIDDLLGDARTFALYLRGSSIASMGLGLRLGLSDGDAAARAVPRLAREVERLIGADGQVEVARTATGASASLAIDGLPGEVRLVANGKSLALSYGDAGSGKLADAESFKRAREAAGTDDLGFFLDVRPLQRVVQSIGLLDPSVSGAERYLEHFDFLAGGSGIDGDRSRGRFVIQTK